MTETTLAKATQQSFECAAPNSMTAREPSLGQEEAPCSSIRIAIVISHPIQYYTPYYRALAAVPGVVLKVFFCNRQGVETYYDLDFKTHVKWDIPLLDGYDFEFLDDPNEADSYRAQFQAFSLFQKPPLSFWTVDNPQIVESLARFRPEVVEIHGYSHRATWRALHWCNQNEVRVVLCSDSNGAARVAWWKRVAKALIVKQIYRRLDGALANGDNNRRYHMQYGMPPERIFTRALPVDCNLLRSAAGEANATRREIRNRHGIPADAFVVIYAGKLSQRKCPTHLLAALLRSSQQGLNVWGLIAGEGELRDEVETHIAKYEMKNIALAGFVNQSEIAKYYAASDCVTLMSSYEPKGLTVPEAGSVGCPAILSDRIGCIGPNDCARPGENTLIYPWGDINAFADCISRLYRDPQLYRAMSEAAVRIANLQDARVAAKQMKEAASRLIQLDCR